LAEIRNTCDPFTLAIHFDDDVAFLLDGSKEALSLRLIQLLSEAEKQLEEKGISSLATLIKADQDKHIALWKRRARILRKMKAGLDQLSE
jgi:hypothetical protein